MKALPTKIGASPKQLAILGALLGVLVVVYWMNRTPSAQGSVSPVAVTPAPAPAAVETRVAPQGPMPARRSGSGSRSTDDFRPSLKLKEGTDVSRIDPMLKLDLLAKLRDVPVEGTSRSIFEFYQPPPPPLPKVAAIVPKPAAPSTPKPEVPAGPPPPPPPPPIPLKFYGYANTPRNGPRRAFFLEGDDIFVAGENDVIRNRYKIVRIGVNSAVVEDTTNKHQQTLPLIEEMAG
jgi:hypothetical protein